MEYQPLETELSQEEVLDFFSELDKFNLLKYDLPLTEPPYQLDVWYTQPIYQQSFQSNRSVPNDEEG